MVVRRFLISLFMVASLFSGVNPGDIIIDLNPFLTNFGYIGPFIEGNEDYVLSGTVTPTINAASVKERIKVYVIDGPIVKTEMTGAHNVTKNVPYTLTFTLPFRSALTKKGLKADVVFISAKDEILYSFSFNVKPIQPQRINPRDYIDTYWSASDIIVRPDWKLSNGISEKYKFDHFLDYFNVDNYYRLDLEDVYITYSSPKTCPPGLAHLHFVDYLSLFPYLDSDDPVPTFDIPLTTKSVAGHIYFTFPSIMYVKPQSLEMSLVARPGFVQTKYFYLPVNHCKDLLDQTFTLVVDEFGHNKNSFSWDIRYINNRNLIGDCSNSDYCVVGEMNNG